MYTYYWRFRHGPSRFEITRKTADKVKDKDLGWRRKKPEIIKHIFNSDQHAASHGYPDAYVVLKVD